MGLSRTALYRETLAAAQRFHARQLWRHWRNEDVFALEIPDEPSPLCASIMGMAGDEFGLFLSRGPGALAHVKRLLRRGDPGNDVPDDVGFIAFSMTRLSHIPKPMRGFLRKAKFSGKPESVAPFLMVREAGKRPRAPADEELTVLLYAINGILEARDKGLMPPEPLPGDDKVLTLSVQGDPRRPAVTRSLRTLDTTPAETGAEAVPLPDDLARLPRRSCCWQVGCPVLPVSIESDDRVVRMALIVDEASEFILNGRAIGGGMAEAALLLFDTFRGKNQAELEGLPEEIVFSSEDLAEILAPPLTRLGISWSYEPKLPLLEGIIDQFARAVAGEPPGDEGTAAPDSRESEPLDSELVPEPDDLAAWKECDRQLVERAEGWLLKRPGDQFAASARYFEDEGMAAELVSSEENAFGKDCYFQWWWLDWRPHAAVKTVAERMYRALLPKAERILLEARMQAVPSVYRVEQTDAEGTLVMHDVLFGGRTTVHDALLAKTAMPDMGIPARLFRAGNFTFISPLGPPLGPVQSGGAIDYLESRGLVMTPEGTRAGAHSFGSLWKWEYEQRLSAVSPVVLTTEGDEWRLHRAVFEVEDEEEARRALAARDDIECDEDASTYVWLREDPEGIMPGPLRLGKLVFFGDTLHAEVHSADRLAALRSWLDALPGVEYRSSRSFSLKELLERGTPLDDRESPEDAVPIPEAAVAEVQATFDNYYMKWLDTPLPTFEGKTLRQLCRTPDGKRKAARLIRSMPNPGGSMPITIPRQALFDALGIEEEL